MILYYFPIAQNTANKTVRDSFRDICLYMYVHIIDYFSIYWSDTSLGQNICFHVAAFVIPFNMLCNMTMF